ncbi:cytidine deaminase [Gordonia sp. NPDC003585]|uniref:cytidine deaminase n=1 Tax=unclassified Gordonia (in: high G+C Gram-positive bacteria) TaxID=2657482 RepID=UPI00339FB78B
MTDDLSDEDRKLVVLARGALARAEAASGAAVRDDDGRTYAGADVVTATLTLSALQVAIATALSSGARGFEAAVVVNGRADDPGLPTFADVSPDAYVYLTDTAGTPTSRVGQA